MSPYRMSCPPPVEKSSPERPRLFPIGRLVLAYGLLAAACLIGACHGLNDADRADLARDGVLIGVCKSLASDCGEDAGAPGKKAPQCWKVFDDCLADAGITVTHAKDGGQ